MIPVNCRRKTQMILIVLVLICMSAATVWTPWAGVFGLLFFLLVTDYLFLNPDDFLFDPNWDNWKRRTDPKF